VKNNTSVEGMELV